MFKKNSILIFLLIIFPLCCSCTLLGGKKISPAINDVSISKETIKGTQDTRKNLDTQGEKVISVKDHVLLKIGDIKDKISGVKLNAQSGQKEFPKLALWSEIIESSDLIKEDSISIEKKVGDLVDVNTSLKMMGSQLDDLLKQIQKANEINKALSAQIKERDKIIEQQNKDLKDFKDGAKKRQETIWMLVEGFAALLLIAGILSIAYVDKKMGFSLVISSLVISSIAYFMAQYAWIVGIFGGVAFVAAFAYLGYYLFNNKKEIEVKDKAIEQSVQSFEVIKNVNWDSKDEATKVAKEKIDLIQTADTKKIVNDIKIKKGIK